MPLFLYINYYFNESVEEPESFSMSVPICRCLICKKHFLSIIIPQNCFFVVVVFLDEFEILSTRLHHIENKTSEYNSLVTFLLTAEQ